MARLARLSDRRNRLPARQPPGKPRIDRANFHVLAARTCLWRAPARRAYEALARRRFCRLLQARQRLLSMAATHRRRKAGRLVVSLIEALSKAAERAPLPDLAAR